MGASSKPAKSLIFIFVLAVFCSARPSARVRTRAGPNATTAAHGATNSNGPKFKPNAEPSAESSSSSSSSAADNMTMVDSSSTLDPSTTIPPGTNLSSPAAQAEPPAGKIKTVLTRSADKQEDDEEQSVSTPKHVDFTPRAGSHASIAANATTTAEQGTATNQTVSADVTTAADETVGAASNNETSAAVNASEPVGVGRKDVLPGIPDLPRLFRRRRHHEPAMQPDSPPPPEYPGATPPTTTITHTVNGISTYHDSMRAPSASTPASVAHQTINPPVTAANNTSNATGHTRSNTTAAVKDTRPASSPSGNGSNVVVVRTPGGNESAAAVTGTVNQTTVSGDNGNGSSYSTVIVGPVGAPAGARPPIPGTARGPPNHNDLKTTPAKLRPHLDSGRKLKRRPSTQHHAGCKEANGNATATPSASKQGAQNTTAAANVTSTAPGDAPSDNAAAATVTGAGLLSLP